MTVSVPTARAAFLLDEAGNIAAWNNACEHLLGFTANAMIGQSLGALLIGTDPNDSHERWQGLAEDRGHTNLVVLRHAGGGTVSRYGRGHAGRL